MKIIEPQFQLVPPSNLGIIGNYKFADVLGVMLKNKGHNVIYCKNGDPITKIHDMLKITNLVFLCLPFGTKSDGTVDSSDIFELMTQIESLGMSEDEKRKKMFVLRIDLVPGITEALMKAYPHYNFVVVTEFIDDTHQCVYLGCKNKTVLDALIFLYQQIVITPVRFAEPEEIEMLYTIYYAYLELKIKFYNDMQEVTKAYKVDLNNIALEIDDDFGEEFQRLVKIKESSESSRHVKELYKITQVRGYDSPILKKLLE